MPGESRDSCDDAEFKLSIQTELRTPGQLTSTVNDAGLRSRGISAWGDIAHIWCTKGGVCERRFDRAAGSATGKDRNLRSKDDAQSQ